MHIRCLRRSAPVVLLVALTVAACGSDTPNTPTGAKENTAVTGAYPADTGSTTTAAPTGWPTSCCPLPANTGSTTTAAPTARTVAQ